MFAFTLAELVTLAPGLRPERRFAPLARGLKSNRRGPPKELFSDNGTNFRGAEREVKEMLQSWNQTKILDCLREKGIQWHFSPPSASHTGGVWERMIRTIRKNIRALVGDRLVDDVDEILLTVMCEVEKIINDRPLTQQCDDPRDLSALTPSTLLWVIVIKVVCQTLHHQTTILQRNGRHRNWPTSFGRAG